MKVFAAIAALLLMLPTVMCELDTSPYLDITSQISEKESQRDVARGHGDLDLVISLNRELEDLRTQLTTPQMQVLGKYAQVQPFLEESRMLLDKMQASLESAWQVHSSDLTSVEERMSAAEESYNSQDYNVALSAMTEAEDMAFGLPASLASACVEGVTSLHSEMERTSRITPSMISMLDIAQARFGDTRKSYDRAAQKIREANKAESDTALEEGRGYSSEGFSMISRAKEQEGDPLGEMKLVLILGPIALVLGLLAYFYLKLKRQK